MENNLKIIEEVSKKLNLSKIQVKEIINIPFEVLVKAIKSKEHASVKIKNVGTFISPTVRLELRARTLIRRKLKKSKKLTVVAENPDPLEFN